MEEKMKKYLFKFKFSGNTIAWIIITAILTTFLLLWDNNIIPLLPDMDYWIFSYGHLFLFGLIVNTFTELVWIVILLLSIKTILTMFHGLIGITLEYTYKILMLAIIFIPFGLIKLGIEIEDMVILNAGLSISWIFIVGIIIYALQFVFEILSIIRGENDEFYLSETEESEEQKGEKSETETKKGSKQKAETKKKPMNEIIQSFEITQIDQPETKSKQFIPKGQIKTDGLYVLGEDSLISAKIIKPNKLTNPPRIEKNGKSAKYIFD